MRLLLLFAGAVLITGCASIGDRFSEKQFYPGLYPGVRNDAYAIAHPDAISDIEPLCLTTPLGWTMACIDVPLSAVLDTLFLPFDWAYLSAHQKPQE